MRLRTGILLMVIGVTVNLASLAVATWGDTSCEDTDGEEHGTCAAPQGPRVMATLGVMTAGLGMVWVLVYAVRRFTSRSN